VLDPRQIVGTIVDERGKPLPGIRFGYGAVHKNEILDAATDGNGHFCLTALPHAVYQISVITPGYAAFIAERVKRGSALEIRLEDAIVLHVRLIAPADVAIDDIVMGDVKEPQLLRDVRETVNEKGVLSIRDVSPRATRLRLYVTGCKEVDIYNPIAVQGTAGEIVVQLERR